MKISQGIEVKSECETEGNLNVTRNTKRVFAMVKDKKRTSSEG